MTESSHPAEPKKSSRIRTADLRHSYCFEAFGVRIRVCSNEIEGILQARSEISTNLPVGIKNAGEDFRPQYKFTLLRNRSRKDTLRLNDKTITARMDRDRTLEILVSQIRLTVAEFAERRVFVHAGVVGWKGKAILIPGRSFSGKSTLTAALVRRGAEYYSDEYAVLDEDGFVHPFPKPISIRGEIGEFRQIDYPVNEFGGTAGDEALPVGLVFFTQYSPDGSVAPELLTPGNGIIETIRHTIPIRHNPELAMATLGRVAETALFIKSERGEASVAANQLIEFLESRLHLNR